MVHSSLLTIYFCHLDNELLCHPYNFDKNMKHPSSENTPVTADSTNRDMSSKMSDSNLKSVK